MPIAARRTLLGDRSPARRLPAICLTTTILAPAILAAILAPATARAAPPPIILSVPDDAPDDAHDDGPAAAAARDDAAATAKGHHHADPLGFVHNWRREGALLGDLWGVRRDLARHGITFAVQETSEALGNVAGGVHKSLDYDGLTQAIVQVNSQRALGYYGGTFNVSALQIHGLNLSQCNLASLQTASGIEATRATRLWEMWYDQKLLPEDRLDIRLGQQSLDQEWMVSTNALAFVNTMFGWPMLPSADMPGGGRPIRCRRPVCGCAIGRSMRWRCAGDPARRVQFQPVQHDQCQSTGAGHRSAGAQPFGHQLSGVSPRRAAAGGVAIYDTGAGRHGGA